MVGSVAVGRNTTHEIEDESPAIDAEATKRGEARAAALSPRKRKQIAKQAAVARWKKEA